MQDEADYALNVANVLGASYADVRIIEQESQSFQTQDLTVAAANKGKSFGIGVRVLKNGGWGFASTQYVNKPGIEQAVRLAVEVAEASSLRMRKPVLLAPEPVHKDKVWASPCIKDPFAMSVDDKLKVLLEAGKIMGGVKGITLSMGYLSFIREKKFFASSEGARITQTTVRSSCGIEAYATDDAKQQQKRSYPNSFGGQNELAGWEMVEKWDLCSHVGRVAEEAVALLTAPPCPQVTTTVLIGGSQVGLQIHESCGHPTELDRVLGWERNFAGTSFLELDQLNKLQYGSPIVNLVADATTPGALGSFGYDDEGVEAQCVYLVKNGLLCGYLSSRDTAHIIGLPRSGGAMRSESWRLAPIIRMTNISLLPGDAGSLEDMIATVDDGIYFDTNKSWSIDDRRRNFQFGVEAAWKIEKGKRTQLLKNASYGGITPVFWNSCVAIGGPSEWVPWGLPNCGKGQPQQVMWTGHGASPALFRDVEVGMAKEER